jgi:6-pyruvoyl-tetrahydropterin synthase
MYTVRVRDHMMIAHSLSGAVFGPAERLHGATYVVDVEFKRRGLNVNGIVVDIGRATEVVHKVLSEINYRNLDEEPDFTGRNTTTEFLARLIFDRVTAEIRNGHLGEDARAIEQVAVTLRESHVAAAGFEGPVTDQPS